MPGAFIYAVARAPFPDSTRLQPIPTSVHPNISGNVQSSLSPQLPASEEHFPDEASSVSNEPSSGNGENSTNQRSESTFPWVILGVLAAITAGILLGVRWLVTARF